VAHFAHRNHALGPPLVPNAGQQARERRSLNRRADRRTSHSAIGGPKVGADAKPILLAKDGKITSAEASSKARKRLVLLPIAREQECGGDARILRQRFRLRPRSLQRRRSQPAQSTGCAHISSAACAVSNPSVSRYFDPRAAFRSRESTSRVSSLSLAAGPGRFSDPRCAGDQDASVMGLEIYLISGSMHAEQNTISLWRHDVSIFALE
jgi:hypothetical protein